MIISGEQLSDLFGGALEFHHAPVETVGIQDEWYTLPTVAQIKDLIGGVLQMYDENGVSYKEGKFDCDDFAYLFRGIAGLAAWQDGERQYPYPVGIVFAYEPPHAMNIALTEDKGWLLIEPQDGSIYTDGEIAVKLRHISMALF